VGGRAKVEDACRYEFTFRLLPTVTVRIGVLEALALSECNLDVSGQTTPK
jgi:hypothetical protein